MSVALPISPPMASISRTKWPLANPPMAGIAGHLADRIGIDGQQQRLHPILAEAKAASTPACPAPTTITSYFFGYINI